MTCNGILHLNSSRETICNAFLVTADAPLLRNFHIDLKITCIYHVLRIRAPFPRCWNIAITIAPVSAS